MGRKWLIVIVYSLAAMLSQSAWILFAPIAKKAAIHFQTTELGISWLSLIYLTLYVPGSVISIIFSTRMGLRYSMVFSCVGMFLGLWIKYAAENLLSQPNFPILLIGQCLVAFTSPVLTNASPRVSAVWMPSHERDMAIVIMNMCSYFGMCIGTAMGSSSAFTIEQLLLYQALMGTVVLIFAYFLFADAPRKAPSAAEHFRRTRTPGATPVRLPVSLSSQIPRFSLDSIAESATVANSNNNNNNNTSSIPPPPLPIVPSVTHSAASFSSSSSSVSFQSQNTPHVLLSRQSSSSTMMPGSSNSSSSEPPIPGIDTPPLPNLSSVPVSSILTQLKADIYQCFDDRSFLLLSLSTFIIGGIYNGMVTCIEDFAESVGSGSREAGMYSNALVLSGVLTSFILGAVLDRTHAYALAYKLCFVFSTMALVGLVIALRPNSLQLLLVMFGLLGAFTTPNAIVAFSLGAELTFPISEDVSATVIACLSQIAGVPFTIILNFLLNFQQEYDPTMLFQFILTPASFFLLWTMFLGTVITLYITEDNKRQRIEEGSSILLLE